MITALLAALRELTAHTGWPYCRPATKAAMNGEWIVWGDSPLGQSIVFRGTEAQVDAFVAGWTRGFEDGEHVGREQTLDTYACFDAEGCGPIISERRWNEMADANAAYAAAHAT